MSPTLALRLMHVALERALHALSDAEIIGRSVPEAHGGQLGLIRAAMAVTVIACDAQCAADYGPIATADEILRTLLGDLAVRTRASHVAARTRALSAADADN